MAPAKKLGLIAGGGQAPFLVANACRAEGRPFFVFCLEGQADPDLAKDDPHLWLGFGAIGKLRDVCKEEGIEELLMIGGVRRPSLAEVKPDWLGIKVLAKIGLNSLGDDGLLRALGAALEEVCDVRLIAAQDVLASLLAPEGVLTKTKPTAQDEADMARAFEVAETLGRLDVGQAVIVQQGIVLGVEAIEGTDALIARAATLKRAGGGGILVKRAKPQQDSRYDLPAIGPDTIAALARAGFAGIAVEAGRSLILGRERAVEEADKARIFIVSKRITPP